jgi:hypothetical protein
MLVEITGEVEQWKTYFDYFIFWGSEKLYIIFVG